MVEATAPRATRRGQVLAWVLLGLLAVVLPLSVADHYGALGIPRSDDWSYLVTQFRLLDGDGLTFNHWVSMTLVGQLVLAAPVVAARGHDVAALQGFTTVLGALGLLCVVATAGLAIRDRWAGLLLAITIAAGPLWGPLAASFMTDVPAFALGALTLGLGVAAFVRRPPALGWLAACIAAGLFAFTVRQYAIVLVGAAVIVGGWAYATAGDRSRAWRVLALGALGGVLAVVFLAWWGTVPDGRALTPSVPDAHSVRVTVVKGAGYLRLVGLLLLPVLVAAGPVRIVRRAWSASRVLTALAAAGAALWLLGTRVRVPKDLFVGNYLMRDGALSTVVIGGHRPDVLPGPVWTLLVWAAELAAVVLVLAVVPLVAQLGRRVGARDWRLRDPVDAFLGLTILGYALAFGTAAFTGLQVYDRYVLLALPAVGLALLRSREQALATVPAVPAAAPRLPGWARPAATGAALVVLAAVGIGFTADSASFDGARWRVAEAATRQGWAVDQVNGGFEWLNFHRGEKVARGTGPNPTVCVTVRVDPAAALDVVASTQSSAPTRASVPVVALRTDRPCTPRHTPLHTSLHTPNP
jgi:hypothetical protein